MKLPKALNEATAGAALKYHIKRALERSHSISDFSRNLELSAQNAKFTNNTLKIIEELNNGVKQASEEIKEAAKPSNLVKSIREQDTRHFEVIEAKDKEAFFKDLNKNLEANATPLPKGMSVEEFKQTLESVENKDRFLEHLGTRDNSDERLAALDLVEPILREPHIEIFIKDNTTDKKEYIKAFKDENEARLYMLITQDNDTILRTFIPKLNERYMRNHVRNADIIHSFIQPNRTAKSDNALSDVVVYGENPTQKPLLDQEELLKTQENLNETTQEAKNLSPLEQANAEKLAKLEHAITPLKEFGKNYPEFALKPKEALEKLLQEKNGQVAGAAFREDLGGIDFVWGNKDYGLEHILKRREDQAIAKGLNETEAKEYALNIVKSIPEIIEKGVKVDNNGRIAIEYQNIRVGLKDNWKGEKLPNHWVITSYEKLENSESLYTSPLITKSEILPLNSNEKLTQKPLTSQEELLKTSENLNETTQEAKNLSPLEQAQAEKLAKLEHAITPLKEFGKNYPEFALKPKEALEKLLQEKNGQVAGAALKYHIKRALERSHSISDFSRNLELSAQNAKFTNNTLKIIEELNNGVKQASEEIKEKARDFSNEKLTNEQIIDLLNNAEIPTSGRDAITFGTNNLTPEIVEFLHKNNKKMIIEKASNKELELLADANFRHPENIRASLDHDAIAHILKRHGVNSVNVRNGEIPITNEDIANYRYIVNNADAILRTLDNENKELISAFKQINGYAVVVEQAINKKNELVLKTMYKSNGDYKDNNAYKKFSSTHTLNADAKVNHRLSSYSGATENPTQKPLLDQEELLKTQENLNETTQEAKNLSPLEQANAEKLAKLESEKLESEKEFTRLKEQEQARKAALKKKLEHERGNAGNIESQTKIEVGEDIPTHTQAQIPKSRVRLNEREIYDLNYAIVKSQDLKPSFTTGGTQKRTDMNEEQIKSIAENFDPKKIFGSGGFEDLPIILHDGQVIAGNHRVQGMLNFTPKSRFAYERAIKEYYHIDLKPDELLVRVPSKRLNNTEINNLAASSNQGRFNSESDHAIAVLSHYEPKLKELETKLNADSIYSLKNMVAKNLNFDKATHPNVGDSNLALLMFNMPRTKTQGIELLNRWQKEFSNDIKSYEKVKKMFVDNAGSFHNLIHDMSFPNVSLNAYLSDIMDRSFANLKNYQTTSESLKDLSEKFYKTSSLEMFEKSDQNTSDISEILGGAIARFARFDDPSKALFEALKSENIKKGLKEFKIADVTKDMFDPNSKEFKDIDIYDFTHYLLMVNREPNENNPTLKRLIEAIKDMQKENEKTIKEVSKTSAEKTEKRIKRDYSDTSLSNDESKSAIK
ncbi:hypothetical protein HpDR94a_06190 [Helicobacter pylori]